MELDAFDSDTSSVPLSLMSVEAPMNSKYSSLALQMLESYNVGEPVSAICTRTGLNQDAVVTRLCVASRSGCGRDMDPVSEDGGIGVQWRFVYWRA